YCVDKSLRASAAAVYSRTVDRIHQQRLWISDRMQELRQECPELSSRRARAVAAAELELHETVIFPHYSLARGLDGFSRLPRRTERKFQPLHRQSCDFPSPVELFRQIGARDWFSPLLPRDEAGQPKRYCVDKDALRLPTLALQVLDRRPAGKR